MPASLADSQASEGYEMRSSAAFPYLSLFGRSLPPSPAVAFAGGAGFQPAQAAQPPLIRHPPMDADGSIRQ